MSNLTRRNFLAASAAAAGIAGLAACDNSGGGDAAMTPPSSDSYPIDPDGDDVEALWTSEKVRDGWTCVTNPDGGQTIGVMDPARIIQVNGLAFRDMDGDGKLSLFEDWRQSAEDRAADLASKLNGQECINLMWHGGVSSVADAPGVTIDPDDFGALDRGSAAGVNRLYADGETYASAISWINQVQEICEKRSWGIPYLNSSDPYATLGLPGYDALASSMDKDVWRKAGMWISRAWRNTGTRIELGPQVDLMTQPTTKRFSGSETEDPALARDFARAFIGGMQSTWGDDEATDDQGWGDQSVACMIKHFVGGGSIETGCDDHGDQGKYSTFPGDNYDAHLVPFLDGGMKLDSTTEQMQAVMPNYGINYSEDGEYGPLYGGAWNDKQLSILRNAGWDGLICTDWGILNTGRGVEDLSQEEKYRLMIDAGVDQYGGQFLGDTVGTTVYEGMVSDLGEDAALERVRESARRILKVMVNVDLFDQPYSDRTKAAEVFDSEAAAQFSLEANEKAVIMLKNAGGVVSDSGLGDKPKVYIPMGFTPSSSGFTGVTPSSVDPTFDEELVSQYFDVLTDTLGDPTGDPDDDGNPMYQPSDIIRPTADQLSDVQYAIIRVRNPQDAYNGSSTDENDVVTYRPVSLQYRPYTADGANVRKTSIAGDTLPDGTKENRSHYGQSTYATNEADLDLIIDTKSKLPEGAKLIAVIDIDRPMVFSELEPYADVILLGFSCHDGSSAETDVSGQAYLNIITGATEPSGLLTYQMPADMDTVEAQLEDVPRDMEPYTDSEGNTYDFCFGLNWSGVIDDERTQTYKANPLTEPETEIVRS